MLQLFRRSQSGLLHHCFNLGPVWRELLLLHDKTQKGDRSDIKLTFLRLDEKFVLLQATQNQPDMLNVLLLRRREDEDVVYVHKEGFACYGGCPFFNSWETAGVLVNPNGITSYSKWPIGVLNTAFHSSPWWMWTRL